MTVQRWGKHKKRKGFTSIHLRQSPASQDDRVTVPVDATTKSCCQDRESSAPEGPGGHLYSGLSGLGIGGSCHQEVSGKQSPALVAASGPSPPGGCIVRQKCRTVGDDRSQRCCTYKVNVQRSLKKRKRGGVLKRERDIKRGKSVCLCVCVCVHFKKRASKYIYS